MQFHPTRLPGAWLIALQPHCDPRGSFVRTYCRDTFRARGLSHEFPQTNVAHNHRRGTLRGLHYNPPPDAETRLVRCCRGRIYDVLLDLRPDMPTFRRWIALELAPELPHMLYVPPGIAHGYQTLDDDTEVAYWMSRAYREGVQACVRWDDPAFNIRWPIERPILSVRDRSCPDFDAD